MKFSRRTRPCFHSPRCLFAAGLWLLLLMPAGPAAALGMPELGARFQIEHIDYQGDALSPRDGFFLRAARLSVTDQQNPGWGYKIEYDVAYGHADAENLYIRYLTPRSEWSLGERKVPLAMVRLASAGRLTFAERPAPVESLTDSTRFGFWYSHRAEAASFQGMLYSRSVNDGGGAKPLGLAGRAVINPVRDGDRVLHLATALAYENVDSRDLPRYRARPEARADRGRFRVLDTGSLDGVENTLASGVEIAWQSGAFTTQAEYLQVFADRRRQRNPRFDGWYVETSYRLTGEARSYDGVAFGDVSPSGRWGAWEVAARYSRLDLNDAGVRGGVQNAVTLALNWYVTRKLRFYLNAVDMRVRDSEAEVDGMPVGRENARIVLLRTQVAF